MKDLWKSGVLVLMIIGVLYILYLRECKHPLPCPPEGQVLVSKPTWDSIIALSNKPPEVKIETLRIKGPVIYVPSTPIPNPTPITPDVNSYADSLVNDSIDVHYDFTVRGTLLNRSWRFSPVIYRIRIDSIVYVPNIIKEPYPVEKGSNGLYVGAIAGGNANRFLFGGGVDFITKKGTLLGYQYQRFGSENLHSMKLGVRIKFGDR